MFDRLLAMLKKEFTQILRDPRMRGIILGVPMVQVLIFGYAVTTDVRHVPTAVMDLDQTPESRELVARFEGSRYFAVVARVDSDAEARQVVDQGEVKAVLRLNSGFGAALQGGRTAQAQLLLDGSDSNTTSIVMGYASRISASHNQNILATRIARSTGAKLVAEPITMASRAWYNPTLESRFFFIPAVIAQLVMITSILLSSMAIVREREIGTMEQIMVSPIGRLEFILGKTLPFALVGFMNVAMVSAVGVFWFGIPLVGSLFTLFFTSGLFLLSTLGVGLLISTLSATQQQAMMTAFFFIMPAILLSGFIYPIANMPTVIQWLTYLNPLRFFLVILRSLFLKGAGFAILWPQMLALLLLGVGMLSLAAGRFKKTME
ncbi:MAG: ABC transporter permease [Holophaga sp.]|nr:ABC transporter permease [Holophaga sp.]